MKFLAAKPHKSLPSFSKEITPPLLGMGAWSGHIPFAYDLVYQLRPKRIVELGVDRGESLFAFSDAAKRWSPECVITGIDSWEGDPHAGSSSIHIYESVLSDLDRFGFTQTNILKSRFEDAVNEFPDKSVDILHIDGWHTYESVSKDWKYFYSKLSENGLVLIHDTRVVGGEFGVHRFYKEIKENHPSIEFNHAFGLACLENSSSKKFKNPFLRTIQKNPNQWNGHYFEAFSSWAQRCATHPTRIQKTNQIAEPFRDQESFDAKIEAYYKSSSVQNCLHSDEEIPKIETPRFSILTPIYQPNFNFLEEAFESVISQKYEKWEWIWVDDGNSEQDISRIEKLATRDDRIRVIKHASNKHIAETLNTALKHAQNDWCCILDQDDLLTTDALSIVSTYIQAHPYASLLYSDEDKTDETGTHFFDAYRKPGFQPDLILSQNYFNHLTCFKRDEGLRVGGFDDNLRGCQDWDFFLKLIKGKKLKHVTHIPYVLYHWRSHQKSTAQEITAKPYVFENSKRCIRAHSSGNPIVSTDSNSYVARSFEKHIDFINITYSIAPQNASKSTEHSHKIEGSSDFIIDTIRNICSTQPNSMILLKPDTVELESRCITNLLGYAAQEHVAFAAPHIFDSTQACFVNAFSIDIYGQPQQASDKTGKDSKGYFMNLALPTNPDILDISLSAFQANTWLEYVENTKSCSLQSIASETKKEGKYFVWVPDKTTISKSASLFSLGDNDHKSIITHSHFVSPSRIHFSAQDEDKNLRQWTGLRSNHHK